mgnify:CR=1 FL=1
MAKHYRNHENYRIGTGNLFLHLKVGNGQHHSTRVKLDKNTLVYGQFDTQFIGQAESCVNKRIWIEINATDTNEHTNLIPVTVKLKDDSSEKEYAYDLEADENGGTVIFDLIISVK